MSRSESQSHVVRTLTAADLTQLRELNRLFGTAFHDSATYGSEPPSDGYVRGLLTDPRIIVLVALVDAAVAGGLVAYELRKFERERSEIYLYDLAVAEPLRRRGIATALLERLCRMGAERGASSVFVQADYVDAPAISLYERFGSREEVLHFDIKPSRGPRPRSAESLRRANR
ncbi:MAG: GNAT family N-acetyltransferase [Steroidobacteraceae bacterium]